MKKTPILSMFAIKMRSLIREVQLKEELSQRQLSFERHTALRTQLESENKKLKNDIDQMTKIVSCNNYFLQRNPSLRNSNKNDLQSQFIQFSDAEIHDLNERLAELEKDLENLNYDINQKTKNHEQINEKLFRFEKSHNTHANCSLQKENEIKRRLESTRERIACKNQQLSKVENERKDKKIEVFPQIINSSVRFYCKIVQAAKKGKVILLWLFLISLFAEFIELKLAQ